MSETLYRKYRPKTFAEVSDQAHIVGTIQNQLCSGKLAHAYLFCGPRGVGKTTIARLLSKAANCEALKDAEPCLSCASCKEIEAGSAMDLIEIDAASHTGVDHVREMIIDNVRFRPAACKMKVFIIDEVHMLSTSAFNALLKTLEEPPAYALFILATTELHKVPETIISRCQRFDFHRIPTDVLVERLASITKSEKAKLSKDVLEEIARRSEGCLRDAESLLGQVLAVDDPSLVLPASCAADVLAFLTAVQSGGAAQAVKQLQTSIEAGVRVESFFDELVALLRAALLQSVGSTTQTEFQVQIEKQIQAFAQSAGTARIQTMIQTLLQDGRLFAQAQFPALALEVFAATYGDSVVHSSIGGFSERGSPVCSSDGCMSVRAEGEKRVPEPSSRTPERAEKPLSTEPPLSLEPSSDKLQDTESPKKEQTKTNRTATTLNTTLDQITEKWSDFCKQLSERSATLPVVLQNANLTGLVGAELQIACPFEFHARQINETKNSKLIEEMLQQIFSETIYVSARHVPADQEEIVVDLVTQFGGSLA